MVWYHQPIIVLYYVWYQQPIGACGSHHRGHIIQQLLDKSRLGAEPTMQPLQPVQHTIAKHHNKTQTQEKAGASVQRTSAKAGNHTPKQAKAGNHTPKHAKARNHTPKA